MFYTNVSVIGDNILYRGVTKEGKRVRQKIKYKPRVYVKTTKPSQWTTLEKEPLDEIVFDTIRDAREFQNKYKDVSNFPIYGTTRHETSFIADEFKKTIPWDRSKLCVAGIDLEVDSSNGFPEPEFANEKITAITLSVYGTYHVFGCGEYKKHRDDVKYYSCEDEMELISKFIDVWTHYYPDIVTGWNVQFFDMPYLINRILKIFGEEKAKKLSPWGKFVSREDKYDKFGGKPKQYYLIYGVAILDYIKLYKKFTLKKRESYKLDYIAFAELGERKTDIEEYETLHRLHRENYQLFIEYNVRDVELIVRLDDKLKLIDLALTLAYNARVNYEDVFAQVRMWDSIIANKLALSNIIVPPKRDVEKSSQYVGAYVKDPQLGLHHWVVSFDLNSLYPHLIMQFAVSPENLVSVAEFSIDDFFAICAHGGVEGLWKKIDADPSNEKLLNIGETGTFKTLSTLKERNLCVAGNGALFKRESGFLPEIMEEMYNDRSKFKKKMINAEKLREKSLDDPAAMVQITNDIARYHNLQNAMKVCLNSAYGTIGTPHFRFFDIRIAEAITMSGQMCIRWIIDQTNAYMNQILETEGVDYVIASDTDSIYLNLGTVVKKFIPKEKNKKKIINMLDRFCEDRLQKHIDKSFGELAGHLNAYSQKMNMKREVLADKGIWTSKKHYILNVYNSEGVEYAKPQIKSVGVSMVQSSTPSFFRERMKKCVEIIMDGTEEELCAYIDKTREDMMTVPMTEVAFPRGTNDIGKWGDEDTTYSKGTPIHVRGSLIFNKLIDSHHLEKKYERIRDGDKVKFIYLREPNTVRSNIIAFVNRIPPEFDLDSFIDYDMQFEKAFIKPMEHITKVIGWKTKQSSTLDDFFS